MFISGLVVVLMCDKIQLKYSLLTAVKLFCPTQNFVCLSAAGLAECQGTK